MDVQEHNATTGEVFIRPMNEKEIEQFEKDKLEAKAALAADVEAKAAKAAAEAKLEALGLTFTDLKALGL